MHLLQIFYNFKYCKIYLKISIEKIVIGNLTKNEVTISFVLIILLANVLIVLSQVYTPSLVSCVV